MSEQQAEAVATTPPEGGDQNEAKTFDAEYVDKLRKEAAKYRTEAKANSDAAKRLAEIEAANQTEAEKAQARVTALEAELTGVRTESMRLRVATENGITDSDDIDLFLTGTDEETLTKQAKRLAERTADRKKNGNHVPREGASPTSTGGEGLETVRGLFGG